MGFNQSSFWQGIENHKMTEREVELPEGQHRVKIKQCYQFLTRKKVPMCIAQVEVVKSTSPAAEPGVVYGCTFYYNADYPSYFFTDVKKFFIAAFRGLVTEDDITAETIDENFIDRKEMDDMATPLAGLELNVIIKFVTKTDDNGKEFARKQTDFQAVAA